MIIKAQGVVINQKVHLLYSPQWGTECGIRGEIKKNILDLNNSEEITCDECLKAFERTCVMLKMIPRSR